MSCNSTKNSPQKDTNHLLQGKYNINSLNTISLSNNLLIIDFDTAKKQISGYSGCNTFTGDYIKDENTLHFSEIASTKKFCPDAIKTEKEVLSTLSIIQKVRFQNKQILLLLGENDNILMTLEKLKP